MSWRNGRRRDCFFDLGLDWWRHCRCPSDSGHLVVVERRMIPVLDPFMAGVKPQGLQRGRGGFLRSADDAPYVSDPMMLLVKSGERKGQVMRRKYGSPSNRGREIENDSGLVKYKQRLSLAGIGMDPSLAERCRELAELPVGSPEFNTMADGIVVAADRLTRSELAADRGTHGHLLCELWDRREDLDRCIIGAGEEVGLDFKTQFCVTEAWAKMLADNGLGILAIEASCVDDTWRLAGTLDRIVRTTKPLTFAKPTGELVTIPANTVLILDIKFGRCRKAHPIQIASYAQSVPYDTETEQRGEWPWPIDQTHALIAHGDFGDEIRPPSIELVWVDLVAGREHGGQCVVDAKAWAARDDVFSVAQIVEGSGTVTATSRTPDNAPAPSTPIASVEVEPTPVSVRNSTDATSPDDCDPHGIPRPLAILRVDRPITDKQAQEIKDQWLAHPDPARLALVDARAALCPSPDEGADWSSDEFAPLWDELRGLFDDLDPGAKTWRSLLVGQAQRRNVPFHAQYDRTERRYYINKAVIALAAASEWTDILCELLSHIIGDVALMLGVEPGHALGSLGAAEAARFAAHVDAYLSVPVGANAPIIERWHRGRIMDEPDWRSLGDAYLSVPVEPS